MRLFHMTLFNARIKSFVILIVCVMLIVSLFISYMILGEKGLDPDLLHRNIAPSFQYLLGTDWLGRDMITRVIRGLVSSFMIGVLSAGISSVISVILGVSAAVFGKKIDHIVSGLIDTCMSVPHIVLLILIAFAMGGGQKGIIVAVALSHWPRLARVVRAETLQILNSDYMKLSLKLGKSRTWAARHHIAVQLTGQILVATILLFPHSILHAVGLSFIGFGLSPDKPCIGILLSESMRYLTTGCWWLAIFPGVALVAMVKTFDSMGNELKRMLFPRSWQE